MTTFPEPSTPKLDSPGAGLPLFELLISRVIFIVLAWTHNRAAVDKLFRKEQALVADLIKQCPVGRLADRVLIPRPRGLEDSSRYWSVLMTLDHLRIVNLSCASIIQSLSNGTIPSRKASTADVKPSLDVTTAVIGEYEESCRQVLEAVQGARDLDNPARFAHPWFGPISARRWHLLAAVHLGLHRRQLESILRVMDGSKK